MAEHSPLPWRTRGIDDAIDADGNTVFDTAAFLNAVENARFIVTACNAHHELLAALKECSFRLATVIAASGDFSDVNARALDAATNAIAKAEGVTHVDA